MPIDDGLREELLAMAADDQDARKSIDPDDPASATRMSAVDASKSPSKRPAEPHYGAEVLDEAPESLPTGVLEAVRGAASALPDVLAVYLVAQRRTRLDGRSQRARMLQLVVRDAPDDEPVPRSRARPIAAEMFAALSRRGEVDVSIGFAAPRFVRVLQARGALLWSREGP